MPQIKETEIVNIRTFPAICVSNWEQWQGWGSSWRKMTSIPAVTNSLVKQRGRMIVCVASEECQQEKVRRRNWWNWFPRLLRCHGTPKTTPRLGNLLEFLGLTTQWYPCCDLLQWSIKSKSNKGKKHMRKNLQETRHHLLRVFFQDSYPGGLIFPATELWTPCYGQRKLGWAKESRIFIGNWHRRTISWVGTQFPGIQM